MSHVFYYSEETLHAYETVRIHGRCMTTKYDHKRAAKRTDVALGDIVVYDCALSGVMYVGRVYEMTSEHVQMVIFASQENVLLAIPMERGTSTTVNRACMTKASQTQTNADDIRSIRYRAEEDNLESMTVEELRAMLQHKKDEQNAQIRASVQNHKCEDCVARERELCSGSLAGWVEDTTERKTQVSYASCKTGTTTYLYKTWLPYWCTARFNHESVYHLQIGCVKLGLLIEEGKTFQPMQGMFNARTNQMVPVEYFITSERACNTNMVPFDKDTAEKLIAHAEKKHQDQLTRVVESLLTTFPTNLASFAEFRAAYNNKYSKKEYKYAIISTNRNEDAALLWKYYPKKQIHKTK